MSDTSRIAVLEHLTASSRKRISSLEQRIRAIELAHVRLSSRLATIAVVASIVGNAIVALLIRMYAP